MKYVTAPIIDRELTAPEYKRGSTAVSLVAQANWVTNAPAYVVTDLAYRIVFNRVTSAVGYPRELTAPIIDRDLTAPQYDNGA